MQRVRGSTSNMIRVFIQDNSVTTGAGLTGLTSASTNLQITTRRELDTSGTIYTGANIEEQTTVGTYQAPSTSAKIRFKAVDATNQPGEYELQFHDSAAGAFGSGDASRYVQIYIFEITTTALKIAPCVVQIDLTADDPQVAKITAGSGAGQLNVSSGKAPATIAAGDIANDAITAAAIANGAIDAATFAAGAIDAGALAANAITSAKIAANAIGASQLATNALGAAQLATDAVTEIVAGLLNTVNTGATFNVQNSVGKQIRQASGNVPVAIRTGTCQTGSTSNTIKLDSGASSTNDIYVGCIVFLTGGTGLGQTRTIVAYNGTTKVATVDTNWITIPNNTTTFEIDASANSLVSTEGTCQGGAASSITLASTASATNNLYNGSFVTILSGTGAGQTRVITAYNGTTKVATVDSAWSVDPVGSDSTYAVIPAGNVSPPQTFTAPSAAEIVQALLGTVLASRDLTAVTAPTVQDSLAASAAGAAGAEAFTGTTLTLKFLDGSTLRTFAVDSGTAPTSRT